MKVSSSGYYEWLNRLPSSRDIENQELQMQIKQVFVSNRNVYGTRRIAKILALDNIVISRKRIGKLMASAGLYCKTKRKFKVTTDSKHNKPIAPNLLARKFDVSAPDKYWVGDITYIRTESGWLYLATVIDLYSRQIIGWSMADNMKAQLINDALTMAIWKRKPKKGLIWHSDRGSQYASDSHRAILKDHGIVQSMSRKGNCWDNAVAESFFHTLKTELTNHYQFKNQQEAKNVIFEYIEVFYNRIRIHSANNYLAPVEFEKMNRKYLKSA
ncbi:MAG: transposase InsO family protein [Polaribacter sp.]|jgi:transposase InsO family protein